MGFSAAIPLVNRPFMVRPGAPIHLIGGISVSIASDSWGLAVLFAPLIYIAILGRRDEPTQRLVALVKAFGQLLKAVADITHRRP